MLDAAAGENPVRETIRDAGAQQFVGDPLHDRVAGQVTRGRFDQRPAHRLRDGVLGERAHQHAVDGPLRVGGGDNGIKDGQGGAAGGVAGRAFQTLSDRNGDRHRPERHPKRLPRGRGDR